MNDEQRQADTRELLIRLDERLKGMQATLTLIQGNIVNKVENDQEYKAMTIKVDKMWDLKNRAMGYVGAWAAFIALCVAFAVEYVRGFFAK